MSTTQQTPWTGVDPYDALRGRHVPTWARNTAIARQVMIQARKRMPFDLAPVLGVEPFVMAKSVSCFLSAAARQAAAGRIEAASLAPIADELLGAEGNLGAGRWGYEFDVQTRWAYYAAGSPNIIVTVFAGRAFAEAWLVTGDPRYLRLATDAARFVASDLFDPEAEVFRYVAGSTELIHNANALGAGLCAVVGAATGDQELVGRALMAGMTTARAARQGSWWPYGESPNLSWVDNFHTAYTLDGLWHVYLATGHEPLGDVVRAAAGWWTDNFFAADGAPASLLEQPEPYDIHSCGTAVDVITRLGVAGCGCPVDLAPSVADWTRANLIDPHTGTTWYRKAGDHVDRRHFVRWGDAHWALGTSSLSCAEAGHMPPIECFLTGGV